MPVTRAVQRHAVGVDRHLVGRRAAQRQRGQRSVAAVAGDRHAGQLGQQLGQRLAAAGRAIGGDDRGRGGEVLARPAGSRRGRGPRSRSRRGVGLAGPRLRQPVGRASGDQHDASAHRRTAGRTNGGFARAGRSPRPRAPGDLMTGPLRGASGQVSWLEGLPRRDRRPDRRLRPSRAIAQWPSGRSRLPFLQWRDRAGFTPASLAPRSAIFSCRKRGDPSRRRARLSSRGCASAGLPPSASARATTRTRLTFTNSRRPEHAQLAPVARLLDAAEGEARIGGDHVVDEHHAGLDLPQAALAPRRGRASRRWRPGRNACRWPAWMASSMSAHPEQRGHRPEQLLAGGGRPAGGASSTVGA